MKIKDGFVMRQVAGKTLVLPGSEELDRNITITLNGTAKFLWEQLQSDTDEDALTAALLKKYDVTEDLARQSVTGFVAQLEKYGFLE